MEISVQHNIKQISRGLTNFQRKQVPFATSQALNDVALSLAKHRKEGCGWTKPEEESDD